MSSQSPSLAVLGSLTLDEIVQRKTRRVAPGGSAWYASITSATLGFRAAVISRIGRDYPQSSLAEMKKHSVDTGNVRRVTGGTCRFELSYRHGSRSLSLLEPGEVLSAGDLGRHWDGIHIGPVFNEVPLSMIKDCRRHANVVSMDLQGFVRAKGPSGKIFLQSVELGSPLRSVDLLKASVEEALVQTRSSTIVTAIARLLRWCPRWLVLTLGSKGSILARRGGEVLKVPAYPERKVVDPTGAGDALVGGWLSTFVATGDPLWAMSIGTGAASLLVRRFGPARFRWSSTELLRRAVWVRRRIRPFSEGDFQ